MHNILSSRRGPNSRNPLNGRPNFRHPDGNVLNPFPGWLPLRNPPILLHNLLPESDRPNPGNHDAGEENAQVSAGEDSQKTTNAIADDRVLIKY